jgi:hypothetical protein
MTGPVLTMAILAFPVAPDSMPIVDEDVLVWPDAHGPAELGAWLEDYWVDAHGSPMSPPVAWAAMPMLPLLPGRG